jgi:Holliday junction resolvase
MKRPTRQTPYAYGRAFEYRVRADLEKRGYVAIRAAGSRGPVDIIALSPRYRLLVQCKINGKISPLQWAELYELAAVNRCVPVLASAPNHRGCVYDALTAANSQRGRKGTKERIEP